MSMSRGGKKLILQWHITARCNLRCSHCYQDTYTGDEMSLEMATGVIEQYKALILKLGWKGHINITGGEPFIRDDFSDILNLLEKEKDYFSHAILTNGTVIDNNWAQKLKRLNIKFVQISMDGYREAHDNLRGKGSFEKACDALGILNKAGVPTLVSFTAHRDNYKDFPLVAAAARKLGVEKVWSDRIVTFGNGRSYSDKSLNSSECMEFFELMKSARKKDLFGSKSKTTVALERALQFLVCDSHPYRCTAGDSLITIMEDGTVYPCRRLPIKVGNVFESTLEDIYFESGVLKELRTGYKPHEGCISCSYNKFCRGGSKCIAYAVTGDLHAPDPGCPIAEKRMSGTDKR